MVNCPKMLDVNRQPVLILQDQQSENTNNLLKGVSNEIDAKTGVNIDTELGIVISLQNAYNASAKGLKILQELNRTLLDVF